MEGGGGRRGVRTEGVRAKGVSHRVMECVRPEIGLWDLV